MSLQYRQKLLQAAKELYKATCSHCQTCLDSPGKFQYHHPEFSALVKSAESCHLCELLLKSLDGRQRDRVENSIRSGSYAKVMARISLDEAFTQVITRDSYIEGKVKFYEPSCKLHQRRNPCLSYLDSTTNALCFQQRTEL